MANLKTQAYAYKQTRVKTAGQGQIIVMLYDEAIKQLSSAISLLRAKTRQLDKVNNAILKAKDIVTELMISLDIEQGGDFAKQLFAVYQWFTEQLMEGNIKKDAQQLEQVQTMMSEIRDAWSQIVGKTEDQPKDFAEKPGLNIAG